VQKVADECGVSAESCDTILTEKLNMHRVAAKFLPRLLKDEQKERSVVVSQELLQRPNDGENFLKNIVRGEET
jgi:hypothetical protein